MINTSSRPGFLFLFLAGSILAFSLYSCKSNRTDNDFKLDLPDGFKAITVVEKLGANRHIAVNSNGDIYIKLDKLKDNKGIYVLREINGKYEVIKSFGDYSGTGIAIKNGYLYASSNSEIFRYKMVNNEVTDPDHPEKIVTGLVDHGEHNAKSITLDDAGNIYVNIGAPSNACQVTDRTKGSPGQDPCPILQTAGGIWQFKVDKLNQSYDQGVQYSTGSQEHCRAELE